MPDSVELDLNQEVTLEVVGEVGPRGPAGPVGPVGPMGPQGSGVGSFVFNQLTPATVWTVVHDLVYPPAVTVIDSAGTELWADVTFVDANTIVVEHGWPTAGTVYLS